MKINFEGTVEEYQSVFHGGVQFVGDLRGARTAGIHEPASVSAAPVSASFGSSAHIHQVEAEVNQQVLDARNMKLPELKPELREAAWEFWKKACTTWVYGFEIDGATQPDRLALIQEMGSGRWPVPILVMIHEIGSLQALVAKALIEAGATPASMSTTVGDDEWLDYVGRVAANMVQVGHMGFSDLSGLMDYSLRWRRN
jgi:hypothetical protein